MTKSTSWRTSGLLAAIAVVSSCQGLRPGPAEPATSPERDLAIYEAVFRHQFGSNASGLKAQAPAYFLSIQGRDPPQGFLRRFEGHRPLVRPGSGFERGRGLHFRLDVIREVDAATVEVDGGYYEAELSASGNTYRVELRRGAWVVTSDKMEWIS